MAREHGAPILATAAALEFFRAGLASIPDDNQAVTKVVERAAAMGRAD